MTNSHPASIYTHKHPASLGLTVVPANFTSDVKDNSAKNHLNKTSRFYEKN